MFPELSSLKLTVALKTHVSWFESGAALVHMFEAWIVLSSVVSPCGDVVAVGLSLLLIEEMLLCC